ncbi:MAG: hypothetical protein WCF78_02055 [archaeon]|jgi:ribosomal protein L40E
METLAKERRLKHMWVCMACNGVSRAKLKPTFCKRCGSIRMRAKKKGKRTK